LLLEQTLRRRLPSRGASFASPWVPHSSFLREQDKPDKAGKLPPHAELKFDPATTWGKARSIPVPGGGGYWTWNFFVEVRQQPEFANGVPVRTGDYIVVPRGHLKRFGDVMKNYELKRGVVVPKGTKPHEVYGCGECDSA
jgi:hypothetical protein